MQCKRSRFDPWVRKIPWRRKWQPSPVFSPGKSHRQRQATAHCITNESNTWATEGFPGGSVVKNLPAKQETLTESLGQEDSLETKNSNPFQYSCQGNPMDRGRLQFMELERIREDLGTQQWKQQPPSPIH